MIILKFKNKINNFIKILGYEDRETTHSGQLENFAKGVLATTSIIWIVYCILLIVTSTSLLFGTIGLVVLVLPFSVVSRQFIKKLRQEEKNNENTKRKVKDLLISLLGFGITCWLFDIFTTFFALDVIRQASNNYLWSKYVETNPLCWPLGIVVGLVAYLPSGLAVYYLLYKIKTKESVTAALFIAFLSFGAGFINLFSGIANSYAFALGSISNVFVFLSWVVIIVLISVINLIIYKRDLNGNASIEQCHQRLRRFGVEAITDCVLLARKDPNFVVRKQLNIIPRLCCVKYKRGCKANPPHFAPFAK